MPARSVSEVSQYLKNLVEQDPLLTDLWIFGEVSNLRTPASGHSYFTLRDKFASIRAVMFKNSIGSQFLVDGAAVVAHGRISLYEIRGDLQFVATIVQPEGTGEMEMQFQELKARLENEGLFDLSRKRPLPPFPSRIGVVTSPSGSVWHDIQTIVARRYPITELVLSPTTVQGKEAPNSIINSIDVLNNTGNIDVMIVARGGGSLEDLLPFNEESVARAIYAARMPVVSAVGHETDTTIADLVADHRASTPSTAAEMTVPDRYELLSSLLAYEQAIVSTLTSLIGKGVTAVDQLRKGLDRSRPNLDNLRIRLDELLEISSKELKHDLSEWKTRVIALTDRIETLSPQKTLLRGYAIVHSKSKPVTDPSELDLEDLVDITLAHGGFSAKVKSTKSSKDESNSKKAPFV
ncbi:MAG: exodeoxyribonuclease VII large subunit [SAR202 cluster bacterium]|jgi:exodeoxyribonuclease VII large subunit|nr:exodeoxyribonuclease VII large subunit [SAR202 cluster bacterium]